jgi:antitoxin component of MazEF toxin-antitoxin module
MSKILHQDTTNIGKWGNSLGIRIKQIYAELAGINEKDTEVKQAVIQGQHGIFIGIWLPEEQPDIQDFSQEKIQEIIEKGEQ